MVDELKIYYSIDGKDYDDSDLHETLSSIVDKAKLYLLEKFKYQLMWGLRSIEKEYKECGCFMKIVLHDSDINPDFEFTVHDVDEDLLERINELISAIKFRC